MTKKKKMKRLLFDFVASWEIILHKIGVFRNNKSEHKKAGLFSQSDIKPLPQVISLSIPKMFKTNKDE